MQNEMRAVLKEFKDELKVELVDEMRTVINTELKDELKTKLKEEITEELRHEIRGTEHRLGSRIDGIDRKLDVMDDRFDVMDGRLDAMDGKIECGFAEIKLILENEIRPNISKIAEGYALLEERLDREAAEEREYRKRVDYRLAALANQN